MKTENRYYIRIQSPVHVGCDEVYEPMGFVVDENVCTLTSFDSLDFFRNLSSGDKNRFADICRKGTISSLLELSQFMRGKKTEGYRVKVCRGFIKHYKDNLSLRLGDDRKIQNEINKFSVLRTAFNEYTNLSYLPGSSIKGALRTAYLSTLQAQKKLPLGYRDAKRLETDLLDGGSFNTDPFRLLKVSDFLPVQVTTKIVYAVNEKKKPSKLSARGPYQILEIIEAESIFIGTIAVEDRYTKEAGIKLPLTIEDLLKSTGLFYGQEKRREEDELKAAGLPFLSMGDLDGGIPVRIGRHCGAESVTIEGHRDIKIMQKQGEKHKFGKGATTFWLAADAKENYQKGQLQPFGWVALVKMTEAMSTVFEKMRAEENKTPTHIEPEHATVSLPAEIQTVKETPPPEETWESSYVSFSAGGGGVVTATSKDGKKAEIRGKEKALAAVAESLHKRLFEKPRNIPKASVTVRKIGNNYEIILIKPVTL
jgi:CRISPR-associated protein Csm5